MYLHVKWDLTVEEIVFHSSQSYPKLAISLLREKLITYGKHLCEVFLLESNLGVAPVLLSYTSEKRRQLARPLS